MNPSILKSAAMTRNYTRASFNSTSGSDKKIVQQFRYEPENDNRQPLYPVEDNFGLPPKTKRKPQAEDMSRLSIAQLNAELQSNNSQMIALINKRKQLLQYRKQKLKEQYQLRANMNDNQQIGKIGCFVHNADKGRKVLESLIQNITIADNKKIEQEAKSKQFWVLNKRYQNDIQHMLGKLKQVDFNLEKQTVEVANICKSLDAIEDTLKEVVLKKSQDHIKKAEPLFINKKKTQQLLSVKVAEKQRIKDQKIQYIKSIKQALMQLKQTRDQRVQQLYVLFGIEQGPDPEQSLSYLLECNENFEELIRMRDRSSILDIQQKDSSHQLQGLLKGQQTFYMQLVKRQTQQSRVFQNYYHLVLEKAKFNGVFQLFGRQLNTIDKYNMSTSDILYKHKLYKQLLKSLTQQDRLLKQALIRTNDTYRTFVNILKSNQSQKQRRKQLLNILETCAKYKHQQQQKKDYLRNVNIQITKMNQRKQQIEDQLQIIMTDGDLQSYKNIGDAMNKCESDLERLSNQKRIIQNQIQSIDKQIVSMAEQFKTDYADIIKDILPRDFEFSFKSSDDVKQVKNYIRKTYKRMGLEQEN